MQDTKQCLAINQRKGFASLDFDAVAKSVHAMQPSCQPGNVAESDTAQADQEAGDNVSPSADAGPGDPS